MSLITVKNLTFAYDGSYDNIFENVSFQIDTDWRLGFVGRNGRGKTTFLNLLFGKYEYKGSITASVDFSYFPYAVKDPEMLTLHAAEAIDPHFAQWELERELSLLQVDTQALFRPFCTLSKGEQTKVLLALLFLKENRFLLIDEPTNHLDAQAREVVARYLQSKQGFILVSHDRSFLDACVDHILSINKANIEVQKGSFSSWFHNKELQDNFELEKNAKLKKEIARLEQSTREKAAWSDSAERKKIGIDPNKVDNKMGFMPKQAAKAKKMMSRAKAIEGHQQAAIAEKSKLLKNLEQADNLKLFPIPHHAQTLLELRDVGIRYGEKQVCEHVSLTLRQGRRIAVNGRNGAGKSSILKLVLGEDIPHTGSVHLTSNLKISYVSQDTSHLRGSLSGFITAHGLDETVFKTNLRKLDFERVQFDKPIEAYSEGQKKKLLLAKSLCEQAHLYIWDEPLNFIDVYSRMQIEELLQTHAPTMLFVEHDKYFAERLATAQLFLE
ncbi:MAG: ABC-F type ribosomal protection protein [Oscillospiraceae bacterium]|jgi:lincosamide and streptogramin A transport system ATP-binding/permease protein|nr:ABC-F type ribosomal protection protein [Oscillospiraceae bacterium]